MIRAAIFTASILIFIGCSNQITYSNQAYIKNTCNQTISLTMRNASNFHHDIVNIELAPNDILVVASYKSYGEHISKQIADNYSLTVKDSNGVKTTDGKTLRSYLNDAKKSKSGQVRSWLINSNEICPKQPLTAPPDEHE